MDEGFKWIGGLAVTILMAVVGYMINAVKDLSRKQSSDVSHIHARIEEVRRDYVRRDDFKEFKDLQQANFDKLDEKIDRLLTRTDRGS